MTILRIAIPIALFLFGISCILIVKGGSKLDDHEGPDE